MDLSTIEKVQLTASFADAAGNPAAVDGLPSWTSSDDTIIQIADIAADGMSCFAVAVGPVGTARVTLSADADMGAGTRPVTAFLDFNVIAAEAVTAGIAAGTPVLK